MRRTLPWFMLFLGLLLAMPTLVATAQEDDYQACSPIDVVFLIDQSSSMSGSSGNDLLEQRKYAVQVAIDLMADIALDSCPGVVHRVGIISYGTTAEVDLPLSEIGPFNPAEPNVAYARRDELRAAARAAELGQTNASDAFTAARAMLGNAAPLNDGEQARKRAIIFVTDGLACVDNDLGVCTDPNYPFGQYMVRLQDQINDGFTFDPVALAREQCLQTVRAAQTDPNAPLPFDERQRCLTENPAGPAAYDNSTFIWAMLMRNGGRPYPKSVYDIWQNIVNHYAGQVIPLTDNRQEVPTAFRTILEQMTGVRAARLECGNFAVNPYLKKAVFNFNKFEPSVKVTLSYVDTGGTEHVLVDNTHDGGFNVTEHLVSGPNERYELAYPYPGLWSISSEDCNNLDAFYQPIEAAAQSVLLPPVVAQYDLPPFYNPDAPLHLEFQFIDAETRQIVPQADHSQFALAVTAEVSGPDGPETYTLEKVPNEELYRTTDPLPVSTPGNYTVKFRVATNWHEGEPNIVSTDYVAVFNAERVLLEQTSGFQVRPVIPFRLDVVSPAAGQTLTPVHVAPGPDSPPTLAPVPVRLRLVNRDGSPFADWAIALPRPDSTFVAQWEMDGQTVVAPLTPDPQTPGEFVGQLPGAALVGEQSLTVQLSDLQDITLLNEDYYPDNPRQPVTFNRADETWRFHILSPEDGETQRPIHRALWDGGWPLAVRPLPVRVELVDAAGQAYADPAAVMAYAPRVISATLNVADTLSSVYLEPDEENPGQYVGQIVSGGQRGEQTLTVDVDYSFPDYDPASEPARATFTRADSLFTSTATYFALLALLLLLLALLLWRYFAVRNNPVRGQLVFTESGSTVALFALNNGKNERVISKRELQQYPALRLESLRVSTAGKPPKARRVQPDNAFATAWDAGAGGAGAPPVRVEYRPRDGQRRTESLSPHIHVTLGDTPIAMEYQPLETSQNGS